jgi:hypothetical protein
MDLYLSLFGRHVPLAEQYVNQRFSTQITPLPVFLRKKSPRPVTVDFHHLQAFRKASFNKTAL